MLFWRLDDILYKNEQIIDHICVWKLCIYTLRFSQDMCTDLDHFRILFHRHPFNCCGMKEKQNICGGKENNWQPLGERKIIKQQQQQGESTVSHKESKRTGCLRGNISYCYSDTWCDGCASTRLLKGCTVAISSAPLHRHLPNESTKS